MTITCAIGCLSTSSATNVGEDTISLADAKHIGCEIIDWFYDAGVWATCEVSKHPRLHHHARSRRW